MIHTYLTKPSTWFISQFTLFVLCLLGFIVLFCFLLYASALSFCKMLQLSITDWHVWQNISCPAHPSHNVWNCNMWLSLGCSSSSARLTSTAWLPQPDFLSAWLWLHWGQWAPHWQRASSRAHMRGVSIFSFSQLLSVSGFLRILISKVRRGGKVALVTCVLLPVQGFQQGGTLLCAVASWLVSFTGLALVSSPAASQASFPNDHVFFVSYWVKGYHDLKGSSCSLVIMVFASVGRNYFSSCSMNISAELCSIHVQASSFLIYEERISSWLR